MLIKDHWIEGIKHDFDEQGGPLQPALIVIHYAVTTSALATARVLRARDYVSCHLTIDRDGTVIQQVPFNRIAFHAGASTYENKTNVNRFSIGIEVSNPGPLLWRNGKVYPTWPKAAEWTLGHIEAFHKHDTAKRGWKYWAEYSAVEFDLCGHLCMLLKQTYPTIKNVVGHDDIAPGRKFDPGPAFPMTWLRSAVFPERKPA
jgi:N-acetylmuramoyl-L-alanine amidase